MKNTLKKLLIAAGICVASTSAFAIDYSSTYFVQIINHSGKSIYANYEEIGSDKWDGSNGGIDGAKEMTYSSNTWIANGQSDWTATRDNSSMLALYTNRKDVKYFSITVPTNDGKGRKVIFHLTNEIIGSHEEDSIAIGSNYASDIKVLPLNAGFVRRVKVEITLNTNNRFTVSTGFSLNQDGWDNATAFSSICRNDHEDTEHNRCFVHDDDGYNGNFNDSYGFNVDLPSRSANPVAAAAPVQAPQGTYNFGQWKAGEYPVVYSPKEVHPFVTYNGKGYVACNSDTTAKDVPGKSAAWKEVNGSLGNTCGYTVHSAKKQSTTPSIAKSGASFW